MARPTAPTMPCGLMFAAIDGAISATEMPMASQMLSSRASFGPSPAMRGTPRATGSGAGACGPPGVARPAPARALHPWCSRRQVRQAVMKAWLPAARQDPFVNLSLRRPSAARRGERHQVDVGERGRGLRLGAALAPDRRKRPRAGEDAPEELAGVARPDPGDLLGSALGD